MKNFKIILALAIGFVIGGIGMKLTTTSQKEKTQKNEIVFVWDGLEKDIPQDGDRLINISTNENTVHLNPVD
ncbi:MAG: hypothetical protein ACK518_04475 [bacterium]|jgi:hypothetical protein